MIICKKVKLRNKKLSDARDDYSWQTDPELAKLDATAALEISYTQYLSEYTFDLCYPSSSRNEYAIETLDGRHIGNCCYYNKDSAAGRAEIGIMIGERNYWGKGYGSEAINALLEHIFHNTSLHCIYLTTLEWNKRAQLCFRKCGFFHCGNLTRDGLKFYVMTIRRDKWEKQKKITIPLTE